MRTPRNSLLWLVSKLEVPFPRMQDVDRQIDRFYRPFPVRRGAKVRQIDRPVGRLRFLQDRIKDSLLATFRFPERLHGCVRGRSPFTNADEHPRPPLVANLDLADFYPSVTCAMVYTVWHDVFAFGPPIAGLLTRLTTYRGHLPQGAPTSGYLANMVLLPAVDRIKALAESYGCTVTFYVDDMTISGRRAREVLNPLIQIIHEHGLSVRHGKTKVMRGHEPQIITGYTVNSGRPSVPLAKRENVRELIHELHVRKEFNQDVGKLRKSVDGRISYIRQTNPGYADRLNRLLVRL